MGIFGNHMSVRTAKLVAVLLAVVAGGCASSPLGSGGGAGIAVTLNFSSSTVQTSGTEQFTATVQNSTNTAVTWQVNGVVGGNATVGTISNGLYTAPASVPNPATVTIAAVAGADSSKMGSTVITITAPIGVSVAPTSHNVQAGQTQTFTATVTNDTQNKGVTWALSGTGCSGTTCGTLSTSSSASGVAITYTAPVAAPSPATVTLTATSVTDGSKSGSATITVTAPPAIVVMVSLTTVSVQASGGTQPFTATLTNDTQNNGVTWTLSGTGCSGATCGTLSSSTSASDVAITYTAPAAVPSPATVTLKATSVSDSSKSASATITVTAPPAITVTVLPNPASVQAAGGTKNFTATVTNDTQNKGVTWALSGTGCSGATCGTLSTSSSASGVAITYTAPAAVPSPATVTLTATSVTDGSKSGSATITVTAPPAIVVMVSPGTATVQASGGTHVFTATVTNDTQNQGVTWTLSGAGCSGATCGTLSASSSASGVGITYTAPAAVPSPATVTLTATSVKDGSKSDSATITVAAFAGNISVTISPKRGGLTLGQTLNFSATVTNDVGNAGVTWSVTGGGILSNPTTTTAIYTAPNSPGVVSVTATSVIDPTKSASASIGVTDLAGVFTYHNDLARDGVNAQEYALTTANVTSGTFGKLFSCAVDGAVYAQPLWVANLSIGGVKHNAVFVATTHNTVYGFDADAAPCQQLWTKSLLGSGETWVDQSDVGTGDI